MYHTIILTYISSLSLFISTNGAHDTFFVSFNEES